MGRAGSTLGGAADPASARELIQTLKTLMEML
jgi:hypothetical protein